MVQSQGHCALAEAVRRTQLTAQGRRLSIGDVHAELLHQSRRAQSQSQATTDSRARQERVAHHLWSGIVGTLVVTIDGAQMSGSGTIVRYAVALAAPHGEPVRVINARQRRREPGLRPQHVTSVHACAELCGATVEGADVGSRTFEFVPGPDIRGGNFEWDIGTAGSATMLALSVLPAACFAAAPRTCAVERRWIVIQPCPYMKVGARHPCCAGLRSPVCGCGVGSFRVRLSVTLPVHQTVPRGVTPMGDEKAENVPKTALRFVPAFSDPLDRMPCHTAESFAPLAKYSARLTVSAVAAGRGYVLSSHDSDSTTTPSAASDHAQSSHAIGRFCSTAPCSSWPMTSS